MISPVFATSDDVHNDIITTLEAGGEIIDARAEFDIDAIADACFDYDPSAGGFVQTVTAFQFWTAVAEAVR